MFETHSLWMLIAEALVFLAVAGAAVLLAQKYLRRKAPAPESASVAQEVAVADQLLIAERATNDGLWYWDRVRDSAHFSPRWKELLGYEEDDIGESTTEWFSRIHPADVDRVQAELYCHICGETPNFESRHRVLDGSGNYRWVFTRGIAVRDENGIVTRVGGSLSDMSPLVEAEHRLVREALHDELTSLPNRGYFMQMLERCYARAARREDYRFAVLFMDLDGFKAVNDSFGHAIGDELLVASARKLEACVRPGDIVARLGGDEFTVLLDDIASPSDATRIADRIIESMKKPVRLGTREINVAASIGIALNDSDGSTEELLRSADLAMYRAKSRGRGRYEVFDRAMHSEAVARLRLEAELRNAVERREFQLFYQPTVDPKSGSIRGVEALMRWNHPVRGVVPADEFITVANQTGLIVALGTWMLREACQQVARWQAAFPSELPLMLSVNFCRREMQNPDLFARIERLLDETQLQPRTLRIEITESGIAESFDTSRKTYQDLGRIGVGFQIDDFGTGMSSLSLLHRFPVSAIKIDRSLIFDIAEREESRRIVSYIAAVAAAMGIEIIAEGVETEEQERCLWDLGCCTLLQGYRYSRPVQGVEIEALLKAQYLRKNRLAS